MAKKKQYSFSDEAKRLQKLYTRRETDAIEKRDYEQAMDSLMQKQEAARESMGLNQPQEQEQQFAGGGKIPYQNGSFLPWEDPATMALPGLQDLDVSRPIVNPNWRNTSPDVRTRSMDMMLVNPNMDMSVQPSDESPVGLAGMNTLSDTQIADLNKQASKAQPFGTKARTALSSVGQSPYLPSAISGLSNIGGNLALAAMAKKGQPTVTPSIGTPSKVNLAASREQARKDAIVAKNVNIRNARNLGLNAGATLSNVGAVNAGVERDLGRTLTQSNLSEQQYNVGAENQYGLANLQNKNRAGIINAQLKQQGLQDQLGYTGAALGTIPGVMKDIRQQDADTEMRGIMEKYYSSLGGRNYLPVGTIFGEGAFKHKVKGYNPDGTPITEKV